MFGREYYSRVSVFGLNSLEELKTAVAVSRIELRATRRVDSINKSIAKLLSNVKTIPAFEKYVGSSIGTLLQLTVTQTLVCFDDLERRGAGLAIKDILGLATLLKEERDCKIVLIVNEDALEGVPSEEFRLHGEKIIDRQVLFSLTPEESFRCVFKPEEAHYELIKTCVSALKIPNIRILQRIRRNLEDINPYLRRSEVATTEEVIQSLILYVCSYYGKANGAPPLDFVLKYSTVNS